MRQSLINKNSLARRFVYYEVHTVKWVWCGVVQGKGFCLRGAKRARDVLRGAAGVCGAAAAGVFLCVLP
jgi:hypothetical protein